MPVPFDEWMMTVLPEGQRIQDEVRILYLALEQKIYQFREQFDRRKLFLAVARCVYEHSEYYGVRE